MPPGRLTRELKRLNDGITSAEGMGEGQTNGPDIPSTIMEQAEQLQIYGDACVWQRSAAGALTMYVVCCHDLLC
jgi:hypothetical protein